MFYFNDLIDKTYDLIDKPYDLSGQVLPLRAVDQHAAPRA
jgi:hypothetical protein